MKIDNETLNNIILLCTNVTTILLFLIERRKKKQISKHAKELANVIINECYYPNCSPHCKDVCEIYLERNKSENGK